MRKVIAKLICLLAILVSFMSTSWAELPVPEFNAHYAVYAKGINVGSGVIQLSEPKAGEYQMEMIAEPSSLASIFVSEMFIEKVQGEIKEAKIYPKHYKRSLHSEEKIKSSNILDFDWKKGIVYFDDLDKNGIKKSGSLEIDEKVIDPLSLQLVVMQDLVNGTQQKSYTFIDDGALKTYQVSFAGEERLETALGTKQAIKIIQQRDGSSRRTLFWFDKNDYFIPIQIIQEKEGKEILKTQIIGISRQ